MSKITMYREPLERYLVDKILRDTSCGVMTVKIRMLRERRGGCNWDIETIAPRLPAQAIDQINHAVVRPMRAEIDLAE